MRAAMAGIQPRLLYRRCLLAKIDGSLLISPRNSPADRRPDRRTISDRVACRFTQQLPEIRHGAEGATIASARANQRNAQNAGFPVRGEMEQQVR
jgi:hypothetical protein